MPLRIVRAFEGHDALAQTLPRAESQNLTLKSWSFS